MAQAYIDANIIVRALAEEGERSTQARELLSAADAGKIDLIVTETTLAETVWVLRGTYRFVRRDIAQALRDMVAAPGIRSADEDVLGLALELYSSTALNFADALLAARALLRGPATVYTFDRDFTRVPGIELPEPGGPTA
jgi:predicted nucleic acid-binding protein